MGYWGGLKRVWGGVWENNGGISLVGRMWWKLGLKGFVGRVGKRLYVGYMGEYEIWG